MILSFAFVLFLYVIVVYFICSIPFGVVVVKEKDHKDVRSVGSGNIGTTNVARASGAPAAGLTLLLDAGKGFICTFLVRYIFPALCWGGDASSLQFGQEHDWVGVFIFVMCIVGHVFSAYLNFQGGKGIAVGFGAALALFWPVALILLAVFLVVTIPTRYVSLGSVCAAISLPISAWFLYHPGATAMKYLILISAIVIWAHRENLNRLIEGKENKFSFNSAAADVSEALLEPSTSDEFVERYTPQKSTQGPVITNVGPEAQTKSKQDNDKAQEER